MAVKTQILQYTGNSFPVAVTHSFENPLQRYVRHKKSGPTNQRQRVDLIVTSIGIGTFARISLVQESFHSRAGRHTQPFSAIHTEQDHLLNPTDHAACDGAAVHGALRSRNARWRLDGAAFGRVPHRSASAVHHVNRQATRYYSRT